MDGRRRGNGEKFRRLVSRLAVSWKFSLGEFRRRDLGRNGFLFFVIDVRLFFSLSGTCFFRDFTRMFLHIHFFC